MVLCGETYGFARQKVWFYVPKAKPCAAKRLVSLSVGVVAGRAMALLLSPERAAMPCVVCFWGWRKGEDGRLWLNFVKSIGGEVEALRVCACKCLT